jgi:glyoxylase-like metal-dependent hydrolase (beta-lactamase superfamily II)
MNLPRLVHLAATALSALCVARPSAGEDIEMERVVEDVYVFRAADIGQLYVHGNSAVVVGDDGVLIFDTGARASTADIAIQRLRGITTRPVRTIVNSHWHPDHWSGNEAYRRAFPDVEIIATRATRAYMARTVASMRYALRKGLTAHRSEAEAQPSRQEQAQAEESFVAELERSRPALPTRMFEDKLILTRDDRRYEILTVFGDASYSAALYLPDEKVLFTGDVLVYPAPYTPNGYAISHWLESLKSLRAMPAVAIVPGHGPVLRDHRYFDWLIAVIGEVSVQVQQALERGLTTAQLRAAVHLDAQREDFVQLTEQTAADFDAFIDDLVLKVAQESRDGAQFKP